MPENRLRHDHDKIEELEDLIYARDPTTSHMARDVDAAERDFDIPEDLDVDEALTFPHPKHKRDPNENVELMDTPRENDTDINWAESQEEMLPSDYENDYDDALTTNLEDEDTVAEGQIHELSKVEAEDLPYDTPMMTRAPKGSRAEEAASDEAATPIGERERHPGELESAMQSGTDEEEISIAERFGGEIEPEMAREILRRTKVEDTEIEGKE